MKRKNVIAWAAALALVLGVVPAAKAGDGGFIFSDSGITASGSVAGCEIKGTALSISEPGTYTLTGTCMDGSVKVEKGTKGVTLVLDGLSLAATDTAPVVCGKDSEVTIRVEGVNTLTDGEDPADEGSADAAVADAFEGAAVKAKSGAVLDITGPGTLRVDAGGCKNGVKGGDGASVTVDGPTLDITAANDAINSGGDLTVLGGVLTISAGDDALHADASLTIGTEGASGGPDITVKKCVEGFEGAAVNLHSGSGTIVSSDDGVNAANSGLTDYSFIINVTGGEWYVDSGGDGLDSNGKIIISGGVTEVHGAENGSGGDTAIDSEQGCSITGGTVFTVDTNGVTPAGTVVRFGGGMGGHMGGGMPGQESASNFVTKGNSIEVRDSSGNTLYSATAAKSGNTVVLAGETLTPGQEYTLYVDGGEISTAAAEASSGGGQRFGGPGGMPPDMGQGGAPDGPMPDKKPDTVPEGVPGAQDGMPPEGAAPDKKPDKEGGDFTGNTPAFTDVSPADWYYEAVCRVSRAGIMGGTSTDTFSPDAPVTRGMIAVILYRLAGSPAVSGTASFRDVAPGQYYSVAISWASASGIASGYGNGGFGPDDAVTREQLAAFLYRYARYMGYDVDSQAGLGGFRDAAQVSGYAKAALAWANAEGFINGTDGGLLAPGDNASRSQTAAVLARFCEFI